MAQQNQPERKRRGIDVPWDGPAPKRKPKASEQTPVPQLALFQDQQAAS
jgi:hypothetical protein